MKKRILLVCMAVLTLLSANAQVPTTSTAGSEVWYFIKGMRGPSATALYVTAAADNSQVLEKDLNGSSAQRWKVVVNGDGLALVNKAYGTYLNCDLEDYVDLTTTMTPPTRTLQITPSTNLANAVYVENKGAETDFVWVTDPSPRNTFLMHAGGGGDNYGLVNYFDDYTDNASFLFIPVTPEYSKQGLTYSITSATEILNTGKAAGNSGLLIDKLQLAINNAKTILDAPASTTTDYDNASTDIDKALANYLPIGNAIISANTVYNTSAEGVSPGQFTAEARETLKGVIDAAHVTSNDPKSTTEDYLAAISDLKQMVDFFKASVILPLPGDDKWYYIQGTRPANTYMSSTGSLGKVKDATVIPDDTQLWKIVPITKGYALQNKSTGEYIDTDVNSGTEFVTKAEQPTNGLRFILSNVITNNTFRFWIENVEGSTPALRFHAGGGNNNNNAMNWTGNKNDNCTWLFLSETGLYVNAYLDAVKTARTAYNAIVVGDAFGQTTSEARSAFNTIITAAETRVTAEMTKEELIAATADITATTAAINSVDVKPLISSTPTATYRWYRLINNATAVYAQGKAISSNGRLVNEKFTFETVNTASDSILFRFELNTDKTKLTGIVNKANGLYMGADGTMLVTPTSGNEFTITRLDAQSFSIKPSNAAPLHAANSGTQILNYDGVAGSASAWKFEFVKEEAISAVNTVKAPKSIIHTNNGIITVDGVLKFEVYSVLGQKQDVSKAVKRGVYFVKVNNSTQKIIVD